MLKRVHSEIFIDALLGDKMQQEKRGAPGRRRATASKRSELLSVRLDEATKALLSAAAEQKQSTISCEAAERLIRSFATDAAMRTDFDHPENRAFSTLIIMLDRRLRQYTGRSWAQDPYTWREFASGLELILQALPRLLGLPDGEPVVPDRLATAYSVSPQAVISDSASLPAGGQLGRVIAASLLEVLPAYGGTPMSAHHSTGFLRELYEFPQIAHDLGIRHLAKRAAE